MANDILFYVVLGIAIFLLALIIFIFYTLSQKFSPEMMRVLTTLHAAIFGYESALVDLIGTRGYRTHVFPEIVKTITTLKDENAQIKEIFGSKTPIDAMQKWTDVMVSAKVIQKGAEVSLVNRNGSDEYEIKIPKCSMSHPIHEVMGQKKGICPLALIISSASSIVDDTLEPTLSYSQFTPEGTVTVLNLKKKSD